MFGIDFYTGGLLRLSKVLLSLLLFFYPVFLFAQVSVNVSTLDPVYRDIDKLVAHGLVTKIIVGQKPYSRKEIARITAQALKNTTRLEDRVNDPSLEEKEKQSIQSRLEYIHEILKRLKKDYEEELVQLGALEGENYKYSWHLAEKANFNLTGSNSSPRLVSYNSWGGINAVVNPLLQYQQGRRLIEGTNLSLQTSHWLRLTDYFAFYFQPRFQMAMALGDGQVNDNNVYVMNLYGKLNIKNFEIQAGRDNLFWGQGLNSGLLLSNNPRGLDIVKISNDSPFIMPWIFKYLGPTKLSYFFSNLGPDQNFPYPYLLGYKFSIEPVSFFELGFGMLVEYGGQGAPSSSLSDRVLEAVPFGATIHTASISNSNKLGGIDFRFRIPPARNLELYGEFIYDDPAKFSNFDPINSRDSSILGGIYLGRFTNSGKVDLRAEYHRTGRISYRHTQWISGITLNQFLLGDNLGPGSQGFYLTSNIDVNRKNVLRFNEAIELRDDNDDDTNNASSENRYRTTIEWFYRFESFPLDVKLKAAYERVNNFNFTGSNRNNFAGEIALQFDLDRWTRFLK